MGADEGGSPVEVEDKYYYHQDNLGSTVMMTDECGQVVFEQDYTPFGQTLYQPGTVEKPTSAVEPGFGYTGQREEADIGLYYYNARYYDPEIGRFTREDEYQGDITRPQTLNLYTYVLNNPLKYVDPDGYDPLLLESFDEVSKMNLHMDRDLSYNLDALITGKDVEFVQGILWYMGLMETNENGYGSLTQSAVMSFQEKANLEVDGVVDQTTLKSLLGAMYYIEGLDYHNLAWQWNNAFSPESAGEEPSQEYVTFTNSYEDNIGIRKATWSAYLEGLDREKTIDSVVTTHFAMATPTITMAGANVVDKVVQATTNGLLGIGGVKVVNNGEVKSPNPVRAKNATESWENFLGEGNYSNKHPITGKTDADRIFSQDGTKSIRFGNHEMSKMGTGKFHYHEELWIYDPNDNIMNYYNTLRRVQP